MAEPAVLDTVDSLAEVVQQTLSEGGVLRATSPTMAPAVELLDATPAKQIAPSLSTFEHYERDLTVRAAANFTLQQVNERLADSGQFLPINGPGEITLREVVEHHLWAGLRVGFGSVRDHLLGLRFIDGQGRDIHVGGRTVKNVAGYDLTRFMTGSFGAFGLIHEVTLRTWARPDCIGATAMKGDATRQLMCNATRLLTSDAAPSSWVVRVTDAANWQMQVTYLGTQASVQTQRQALEQLVGVELVEHQEIQPGQSIEALLMEDSPLPWLASRQALVKLVVPPASLPDALEMIGSATCHWHVQAYPSHGVAWLAGDLEADQIAAVDESLQAAIASVGVGYRHWLKAPCLPVEGAIHPLPTDWPMLCRLKQSLDPHGVFGFRKLFQLETA